VAELESEFLPHESVTVTSWIVVVTMGQVWVHLSGMLEVETVLMQLDEVKDRLVRAA
jgi:hypothetical protein